MTRTREYKSGPALRHALEERIKKISRDEAIDLQRLRRQVAFDRFLARLFSAERADWVLKGGYGLELRFQTARATRDLDFTVRRKPGGAGDTVLGLLQGAGAVDTGDHFTFRVGEAGMDLDGAPYGGARYPVEAIMAGRTFVKFHLDVGIGDAIVDPPDIVPTRDWLSFAGLSAPSVPVIQSEQQFAEKIHAYTLPREGAPNSRVRDLVDLTLLVRSGIMNGRRVAEAIRMTFATRGHTTFPTIWRRRQKAGTRHSPPWRRSAHLSLTPQPPLKRLPPTCAKFVPLPSDAGRGAGQPLRHSLKENCDIC